MSGGPQLGAGSAAPKHCIACHRPPRITFRLKNGAHLLRCPRCGLGWWDWPAFDPAALYDESYFQNTDQAKGYDDYAALEPGMARTARLRLRRITQRLAPQRRPAGHPPPWGRGVQAAGETPALSEPERLPRLLELGCGPGVFLAEARRAGWRAEGIEVSEYAAGAARRRGLPVEIAPVEGRDLGSGEYDCVALWDVIEHLRDPARVLQASVRALRPGGVLALSTGDLASVCASHAGGRWHLFNLPEHLFFFTPASLRLLLRQAGARVCHVTREVYWVPVAYLVERLDKTAGGAHLLTQMLRQRLPRGLSALVLPASMLDVLGIYARRAAE